MAGLYVHIPFCASRCIYCGFYSTTGLNLQQEYVDALLREYDGRKDEFDEFKTVYFGGGTPSTLPIKCLDRLVEGIGIKHCEEWTMECNPDDVTDELASWIGRSPINRVSMGAQTFDDARLRWLHRRHKSSQVKDAIEHLRNHGIMNISIDLMYGFPGQTVMEWDRDIDAALALRPQHISAYSLMYEEGTPLYRMLMEEKVEEIDEEVSVAMFEHLCERLKAAGYEHYEISNFALSGFRSRHNSSYWREVPYLGIGAAAHSFDGKRRWWNVSDVRGYISVPMEIDGMEVIDDVTRYNDIITTALRTREGICLATLPDVQRKYLLAQAQAHIKRGVLALSASHLCLTFKGIFVSDDIMSDLIYTD